MKLPKNAMVFNVDDNEMQPEAAWPAHAADTYPVRKPPPLPTVAVAPSASSAPTPQTLGAASASTSTAPVPIGTITFAAVGLKHDDVAAWLDAMAKQKTFLSPIFTSSAETTIGSRQAVDFAGQVTLNSLSYSNRFTAPSATGTGVTTP